MEFKEHELSTIIPSMSEEEYRNLKEDIKQNGLINSIVLYENKILDGRHRYRACNELKLEARIEEYKGSQPLTYIISQNIKRRHLTKDQLAVIGDEIEPILAEEAKKRQQEGGILGGKTAGRGRKKSDSLTTKTSPAYSQTEKGETREHISKLIGVGTTLISEAKMIRKREPKLIQDIRR